MSCDQVRKQFTVDEYSHYVFTPRDLTEWVIGLMRYPLAQYMSSGHSNDQDSLLEMWAYEGRRLFRDRLVGEKSHDQFDGIMRSVLQSDWSTNVSSLDEAFYVTWGFSHSTKGDRVMARFGHPLGRLSIADTQEVISKAIITYGR